jgi:hypothetical protein
MARQTHFVMKCSRLELRGDRGESCVVDESEEGSITLIL